MGSTEALTSCAACGIAFPLGARFCPSCGEAVAGRASEAPASAEPRDPGSEPTVEVPAFAKQPIVETSERRSRAREERLSFPPLLLRDPRPYEGDPLIGRVIAERYRILQLLGRGGMGVVYRVEHVHIGKFMAMKLLSGELASDPGTLKRFQREAQAVSKLSHPNTVQIFDFGESAHLAYLVMEYLPGHNLATVIQREGALPFARVAKIGAQIAASVDEAHRRGIIHRDIKPENVMVLDTAEQSDFVKVLDFGIAKLRDLDESGPATQRGNLIGTPAYMAPEQIRGDPVDGRADIYSLGALMYEAITGGAPFVGESPVDVLRRQLSEPLRPLRQRAPERDIPEQAEQILARALVKDPRGRYATMAELREELLHYLGSIGVEPAVAPEPRPRRTEILATRVDVDRYERRLQRQSRAGAGLLLILLGVAGYGAYALSGVQLTFGAADMESEPNDTPGQANTLVPGRPLRAYLGQRLSKVESDADVYRIDLPPAARGRAALQVADISVSALPNLDLMLELVEKGSARPLLVADTGRVGEPERIPNVGLHPGSYFLRVREALSGGRYPTENVSDSYTVAIHLGPAQEGMEREPNDGFELAEPLDPDRPLQGLVGWAKDRDVYCTAPSAAAQRVELSGVVGLDLALSYLDRRTNAGQRIDRAGPGAGEHVELPAAKLPRQVCFTVSAHDREDERRADPEHPYQIVLR